MLIVDFYSLLPAFTLAGFFMAILSVWVIASFFGMMGYGTTERPLICLINAVVGCFGLIGLFFAHQLKPSRK